MMYRYVCLCTHLQKCTAAGRDADVKGIKNRQIPSNLCTYGTHLAGFFKDEVSPWVLYSIHIQRGNSISENPRLWKTGENAGKSFD
jgi:hypothetical protein